MGGDALLGVAGSLAGGACLNVFAATPDREWLPIVSTALAGAMALIVVQRMFWQAPA